MSGTLVSVPLESCRGCLKPGKSHYLFGDDDLIEKYKYCTQLQIEKDDGLSSFLCKLCHSHLQIAYNFKRMCRETNSVLRKLVRTLGKDGQEAEEPDRESKTEEDPLEVTEGDESKNEEKEDEQIEYAEEIEELEEESIEVLEDEEIPPESQKESQEDSEAQEMSHRKQKYDDNRLQCPMCRKKYSCPQSLKLHMENTHGGVKRFYCDICNTRFTQKHSLQTHMMRHTNERPFQCLVCKKGFRRKHILQMHMNCHTGDTPYRCKKCNLGFRTTTALRNHGHNLKCPICSKTFHMIPSLQTHIQRHKRDPDGRAGPRLKMKVQHICDECGKSYSCKSVLEAHKVIHTGEKPFKCQHCDKAFPLSASLKVHNRNKHPNQTESSLLDLICETCGETFRDSGAFSKHLKSHKAEG
uniref:Uncharacterized protein n=1 Tax=Phlebotomus papatasi TaxID=29031 RepID=A0A1B0EXM9_PHLPP